MNARCAAAARILAGFAPIALALLLACGGPEAMAPPRELLLAPGDFANGGAVTVAALSEEESRDGPSAQVELQGAGFRAVQSLVLFASREQALAALDGIRADLASQGAAGPGPPESSGVLEHQLGNAAAASLFFIESRGLVRLTVTGPDRRRLLDELAAAARGKLARD